MIVGRLVVLGLLLAPGATAMAAARPTFQFGTLACPDGTSSKPDFVSGKAVSTFSHPSERDMEKECAVRAENRRLKSLPSLNRTPPSTDPAQLRRDIGNFVGTPR